MSRDWERDERCLCGCRTIPLLEVAHDQPDLRSAVYLESADDVVKA